MHRPRRPAAAAAAAPAAPRPQRSEGWIGKLLAVAGVAVTLIGVVLLLVLAAQAGILRPEFRVAAGAVLAAALVGAACVAVRATRRAGRCDRVGGHGCRGRVHRRHRRDHDLRLGVRARRAGHRRGHRRRRPDPGPALGLRAPRAAGAGAADRAGAGRDRRHHAAARRVHAGAVGGLAASAAGQGLDLDARRAHRGEHASAAGGAGRGAISTTRAISGWPAHAASRRCWPSSAR